MDFFKSVSARVGDVAKNVGDLLLDSDSESEADERSERTRRGGDDADRGEGSGPGGRRSRAGGDGVAERGAGGASDSEGSEEDDGPLISEDVWNTLRAAKDRVAQAAKTTVASVSRDVAAAAETVRRDLGDLSNLPGESTNEGPVVFVGDAASEYAAGGAGGLGVSVESDDDDAGSDGDGSLDPDVAETFERTAEALENVGEKVERFGAAVFQNAGRLFDKIVDTFEEDDEDRGQGAAAPPGSYGVPLSDRNSLTRREFPEILPLRFGTDRPTRRRTLPTRFSTRKSPRCRGTRRRTATNPRSRRLSRRSRRRSTRRATTLKKRLTNFCRTNSFMKTMSSRIVPAVVEHDVFWSRYFFRLRTLERERDGWEEPLATKTLLEPSGMEERPAGTAAGAESGEENAPDASADSTPFSDSPERTSPETKVVGEGASGEEEGEDARGEEEEEEEEDEEEGTLPASAKTETVLRLRRSFTSASSSPATTPPTTASPEKRPATDASFPWPRTTARSRPTTASGRTGRACATSSRRHQGGMRRWRRTFAEPFTRTPTKTKTTRKSTKRGVRRSRRTRRRSPRSARRSLLCLWRNRRPRRPLRAFWRIPTWTRTGAWTQTDARERVHLVPRAKRRVVAPLKVRD
jgi:hypothetical protein